MSRPSKPLVIIGAGGFSVEALWVANEMNGSSNSGGDEWTILGLLDDNPDRKGEDVEGTTVLGTTDEIQSLVPEGCYFHCAIAKNRHRARIASKLEKLGYRGATLIHPSVVIGPGAEIADGVFIGALTVVAPKAKIGKHVLINTHAGIGHHSEIREFSQVCPAAYVNGACIVERQAFIGTNASLQPGVVVGESATVGANSYVVRSVKPKHTVVGVPSRTISRPA